MTETRTASTTAETMSVVIPCYNEQENIRTMYTSASTLFQSLGLGYELILVDDGSTDQTSRFADALAAADPRVKVIHHLTNLGYGAALRSGIAAARHAIVFTTDGDGQFNLNETPPLLPLLQSFDIVCGFRLKRQEGGWRWLKSRCWHHLMVLLFGLDLKDINCAFKLYKRKVFDSFALKSSGTLISAEILAKATRCGHTITQAGVHHLPRAGGKAKGANRRVILRALWELFRLYGDIMKPSKPTPPVGADVRTQQE